MTRKETLHNAEVCVCGQREEDYGSPEDNFRVIAQYWEVYLRAKCVGPGSDVCIEPDDVANMMTLLKIGRITTGNPKADNYIDGCGYLACAAEIATGAIVVDDTPREPVGDEEETRIIAEKTRNTYCKKNASHAFCEMCQIGRESGLEHISCIQWVGIYPDVALEIMRKAAE